MNVESSAPANTEFRKSANVICTTANTSIGSTGQFRINQRIEGQNVQGIKKGTSAAESLTASFWVKSSNTGTYICEFFDLDNNRQISKSYTIDAADTWEKKIITVPPDTTGQLDNDNAQSLGIFFWLAAGTGYSSGTLNDTAWASQTDANRVVGQLNLANAVGNYFAITGVQLETGTVATPFEMRSYGQELALCQRYYWKSTGASYTMHGIGFAFDTNTCDIYSKFPVSMRAAPTMSVSAGLTVQVQTTQYALSGLVNTNGTNVDTAFLRCDTSGSFTAGDGASLISNDDASQYLAASAEL
jgi:hypothetical protein